MPNKCTSLALISTHRVHSETGIIYFVTFTCYKWLPLFDITNSYDAVYKWFDSISLQKARVTGYVIMPNHVHCMIYLAEGSSALNTIVANGKRFIAYDIVKRLKTQERQDILTVLKRGVRRNESIKGKKHQVFRLSFDARPCHDLKMIEQKLDYIHSNPVNGNWQLVDDYTDYEHSSAKYYETGTQRYKNLTHYKDIG